MYYNRVSHDLSKEEFMNHDIQADPASHVSPEENILPESGDGKSLFIPGGRQVSTGSCLSWFLNAWELFKQKLWVWIVIEIVFTSVWLPLFCIALYVAFIAGLFAGDGGQDGVAQLFGIAGIGVLILLFILFLFMAGIVYFCDSLRCHVAFSFNSLFAAFRRKIGSILSVFFLDVLLFICGLTFLTTTGLFLLHNSVDYPDSRAELFIIVLTLFIALSVFAMAIWFTPALLMLHDIRPFTAIRMSYSACAKNILPIIVFFIMVCALVFICGLTFGLLYIIMIPLFLICSYTSYRNIFFNEGSSAHSTTRYGVRI
jgi:hypothetical protein